MTERTPRDALSSTQESESTYGAAPVSATPARRIAELEAAIAELRAALAASERASVAAEAKVQEQKKTIEFLEGELTALRVSLSWRVTAPLRSASVRARQADRTWQSLARHVRMRGGVGPALSHYYAIFRKEGVDGILRRSRRILASESFADDAAAYQRWIERHDTIDDAKRALLRDKLSALAKQPLISVLVPTYNSDVTLLRAMIESVQAQIYPHWELCIADDASTRPEVIATLREYASSDARIKLSLREQNGHISEASNSALALASGEYVALLDHDDLLPEHALLMVVQAINAHASARLFYSDEDKLTPEGQRTEPYLKSDWNPELSLVQNLFSHLGVYETALVRQAGGFRKGFEGSQDHDLALRCVTIAGHAAVHHIPHVLYHWRIVPGSTAGSGTEKPYALAAGIRSVEEHLARTGVAGTVTQLASDVGIMRVRYAVPTPAPLVSIVIPTRDGVALLRQCIESVFAKSTYPNFEIIVVDNGSVQPETLAYFDVLRSRPNVRVVRDDRPFNFSALNNAAVTLANGEFVCLLNNDIEVITPDWLEEMVSIAAQPGNGAVGACLWYPNDTLQHGGVVLGLGGVAGHMHYKMRRGLFGYFGRAVATQNLSVVTAACLVIRKSIYEEVGGLDEDFAVAFNDVDFCIRVRNAGYRNVWTPHAELYHHESATRGSDMAPEKFQRFQREVRLMESRWGDSLLCDPAWNPNLSLDTSKRPFALADEPRIGQFD
ncbi:glycosyltransferase [Caballeronia sp. LZ062]|uniref:glycosyltransferase family 2 protein n=1 Tax=unclassified Caballeronia TaxID=2646786 RepID=UPI00286665EF|nr:MULTISPECIES: glycosyltransferase [unclassified Caballeronia]MDR5855210.1 glycosyltransferase [Caballeronia sp. LZ050]MDR5870261.1 glycosyltransferase [Caballeronia sp. LZ062]